MTDGCAFISVYLYDLDKKVSINEARKNIRKNRVIEPYSQPLQANFKLQRAAQTAASTLASNTSLLWLIKPLQFEVNTLSGYVIYEEAETNSLILNFYKSDIEKGSQFHEEYQHPQIPMSQSWIIEYPLLAYKSFTPNNSELVVMHLAAEMPQRFISLEEWQFVCFVKHT